MYYCVNCLIILNYRPDFCPNCRKQYFKKISKFERDSILTK